MKMRPSVPTTARRARRDILSDNTTRREKFAVPQSDEEIKVFARDSFRIRAGGSGVERSVPPARGPWFRSRSRCARLSQLENYRGRACSSGGQCSDQVLAGRLTMMGVCVLLTTTHVNGSRLDGLISICGKNAGTWMKSPASALAECSPLTPHRTKQMPDST